MIKGGLGSKPCDDGTTRVRPE
uniref:Uncharacterized protein n=1 Tax=Anguilla anguilla TaxID=7936 RepID=A0A0E9R4C0_ANGAN